MIRAVYRDGKIEPVDNVPIDWREGDRLLVEHQETIPSRQELEEWVAAVQEATAKIPPEDHEKFMAAIAQHRAEAKRQMRREWGLPE
jgi:hypothetical protein